MQEKLSLFNLGILVTDNKSRRNKLKETVVICTHFTIVIDVISKLCILVFSDFLILGLIIIGNTFGLKKAKQGYFIIYFNIFN